MSGKSGTDARFPSEVRQIVVNCECASLTSDQKAGACGTKGTASNNASGSTAVPSSQTSTPLDITKNAVVTHHSEAKGAIAGAVAGGLIGGKKGAVAAAAAGVILQDHRNMEARKAVRY
jgi:uncharacterized protein YcfJ